MQLEKYENGNYGQNILKLKEQMTTIGQNNSLLRRKTKPTLTERVLNLIGKKLETNPLEIFLEQQRNLAAMLHTASYLERTATKGLDKLEQYKEELTKEREMYREMSQKEDEAEKQMGEEGLEEVNEEIEDLKNKTVYLTTLKNSSKRIALKSRRLGRSLNINTQFTMAISEQGNLVKYATSTIPTVRGFITQCKTILDHGIIELEAIQSQYTWV